MTSFYIARQPILDRSGRTFGYELLFRSSEKNAYDPTVDGNSATSMVLNNALAEVGLESIVGERFAFINLTDRFLHEPKLLEILPPGRFVLEVLETVEVTDEVVAGVQWLRDRGHTIALDDFVDKDRFERLLPLADIVKYDITQHTWEELESHRSKDEAAGRRSLAERVETHQEYEQLCRYGFHYFQGYFFAKPKVISGAKLPQNQVALVQLMAAINNPNSTIEEIAEIVGRDVSLGVRTLKYVNSPMTGLSATVTSIHHATVLLGKELIRNWVSLLIMSQFDDKPSELIKLALTRGRFCQVVASKRGLDDAKYFTLGLLSLLDVFMNQALEDVLESITIDADMSEELLNRSGLGGEMLSRLESLEKSQFPDPPSDEDMMYGSVYQEALVWSEETSGLLH